MGILSKAFDDQYEAPGVNEQSNGIMQALLKQYPQLQEAFNSQLTPTARAQLDATKAVTGGYNDLALGELQRNQGKISDIDNAFASAQAGNDIANLNKYGAEAGRALRATDAGANPEYYKNLETLGGKYGDVLNNLSPDLSAGSRAEIERGTARLNASGAENSAAGTAEKAMEFGRAGEQQKMHFANAVNSVAQNLGNLKSGLNPASIALGRDSRTNPVSGAVTGAVRPDNTAATSGNNLLNQLFNTQNNSTNQNAAAFKSWGDALNQDSQTFKNVAGGAAALGA